MAKKKAKSKTTKSTPMVKSSVTGASHDDVIAAALSTVNVPVLMKVCRLCESKDGPFLNIFDSDKATAKKIEDLMPFAIAEYDDLPHKICFRCSAKVEELHEFVQKCLRTQKSLHEALGKKGPLAVKNKLRTQWEEKLNKSNISNDDICDALVKKAMESIKDIPLNASLDEDDIPLRPKRIKDTDVAVIKEFQNDSKEDSEPDVTLKDLKLSIEKCDNNVKAGPTLSNTKLIGIQNSQRTTKPPQDEPINSKNDIKQSVKRNSLIKYEDSDSSDEENKESQPVKKDKPFNIMEYVTTIKVNSVGVLFQCKLCNRNFLKKEVVENHGCARTGIPKIDLTVNVPPPEPPKPPSTVKYIKIDNNKKPSANKDKTEVVNKEVTVKTPIEKTKTSKPRIGPASKVKKYAKETSLDNDTLKESEKNTNSQETNSILPTVTFPTNPNTNMLYKLVPGPNNTFTLVSGPPSAKQENEETTQKVGKKRKTSDDNINAGKKESCKKVNVKSKSNEDVIDLETESSDVPTNPHPVTVEQPYPVGLFQTRSHHSAAYPLPGTSVPAPFTTPAMKKQSYTVLQTGNPSKLVISTKSVAPDEEVPKKRAKKNKTEDAPAAKEPYNVTIEDASRPKEPGFFTFINVDPLLQPSYVLPTNNIIQESQISTSTPAVKDKSDAKDKYPCNMCGEVFSREKKLLTHIQSHYSKMDEEDKLREKSLSKRRGKKS